MNEQSTIHGRVLSIATYKPKKGKEDEMMKLVATHLPTLRELGLATDRQAYLAKSSDGSIIEVFEWISGDPINTAHQHPMVLEIWDRMGLIADFLPISRLPESETPFAAFEIINHTEIS